MAEKDMTIKEIEDARSDMNTKVAELLRGFESDTGIRVGYISIEREKDIEEKNSCNCRPLCYDENRGAIALINIDLRIDFS